MNLHGQHLGDENIVGLAQHITALNRLVLLNLYGAHFSEMCLLLRCSFYFTSASSGCCHFLQLLNISALQATISLIPAAQHSVSSCGTSRRLKVWILQVFVTIVLLSTVIYHHYAQLLCIQHTLRRAFVQHYNGSHHLGNPIGSQGCDFIQSSLCHLVNLHHFHLDSNFCHESSQYRLVSALASLTKLSFVNLSACPDADFQHECWEQAGLPVLPSSVLSK